MNTHLEVQKILKLLGLQSQHIINVNKLDNDKCPRCKRFNTIAKLDPCKHVLCSICMDDLYDGYNGNMDILFECPHCCTKVTDYTYL